MTDIKNLKDFFDYKTRVKLKLNQECDVLIRTIKKEINLIVSRKKCLKDDIMKKFILKLKKISSLLNNSRKNENIYYKLRYTSGLPVLLQELVELLLLFFLIKEKKILSLKQLNNRLKKEAINLQINEEEYLSGFSDMTGEILRYMINSVIEGKSSDIYKIKKLLNEYFIELSDIILKSDIRRKFDAIKYNLEKINKVLYDLRIKS